MRLITSALVFLIGLMCTCSVYASGEAFELLEPFQLDLPAGIQFVYNDLEVKLVSEDDEYTIETSFDELDRIQFTAVPTSNESSVREIYGTLDVTSNGMPYIEYNIEYDEVDYYAGSLTIMPSTWYVLEKTCDCSEYPHHCRPRDCNDGKDCAPAQTNLLGPYGTCSNSVLIHP